MIPDGESPEAGEYTLENALVEAKARTGIIVRLSLRNGTYHVDTLPPDLARLDRHFLVRRPCIALKSCHAFAGASFGSPAPCFWGRACTPVLM